MWTKDGIHFCLMQMGGELSADDMTAMAKEALAK